MGSNQSASREDWSGSHSQNQQHQHPPQGYSGAQFYDRTSQPTSNQTGAVYGPQGHYGTGYAVNPNQSNYTATNDARYGQGMGYEQASGRYQPQGYYQAPQAQNTHPPRARPPPGSAADPNSPNFNTNANANWHFKQGFEKATGKRLPENFGSQPSFYDTRPQDRPRPGSTADPNSSNFNTMDNANHWFNVGFNKATGRRP